MPISNPSDPKLDRWLRRQPPRVELAIRYSMRGRFRNLAARHAFNARINELFAQIAPSGDEYAEILGHAREIGEAMEKHLAEG